MAEHRFFYYFCNVKVSTMDFITTINGPIEVELERFRGYYKGQFDSPVALLNKTLSYVSERLGKLMRPTLVMLVAKSLGEVNDKTYSAAAAVEMLHTASLLHDDVIDESDSRRGKASMNTLYSNKIAILTGDYLFSKSLYNSCLTRDIRIIDRISTVGQQLTSGEMLQMEVEDFSTNSEEKYFEVIRNKTASLFSCSAFLGALSVGADDDVAARFERFGEIVGICFQLRDDIFDYYSDDIGKPTGYDIKEGKITLPAQYILRNSTNENVLRLRDKLLSGAVLSDDEILELTSLAKSEGGIDYTEKKIEQLRAEALAAIPENIPEDCATALKAYVDFVIARKK